MPKYDGDMSAPNTFVPLTESLGQRKIDHLMNHFGSQLEKRWFEENLFSSLLRLRGMECNSPIVLRRGVLLPQGRARVTAAPTLDPPRARVGTDAHRLMTRLRPLCRSLTGAGVRETFDLIGQEIPLARTEVASGTRVFDWIVPDEWNIRDAYIAAPDGTRVVDFRRSNLHVVSYSEPVRAEAAARGAARAPALAARAARPDPLPDLLLRAHLGLLLSPRGSCRVWRPETTRS